MKRSTFCWAVVILAGLGAFQSMTGCKNEPPPAPVPEPEDVWSLLSRGDDRAKDYFLGKVDVQAADSRGRTPLHYAAESQDPVLAAFFIAQGARVDARDNEGQTPLGICAEKGDTRVAARLAGAGADIHLPGKQGISPARIGLERNPDFLRAILTPATVESADSEGRTILHLASAAGNIPAVYAALESAGETAAASALAAKDIDGLNPLDIALARTDSRDHMEIAEQLILAGGRSENPVFSYFAPAVRSANYNMRRAANGLAPLHYAAREGYEGLTAFLIEKNANVNLKNDAGATPLHEAARSGNPRVIEMILNQDAEVNVQDAKGNSPLHIGIPPLRHRDALNLFLAYGANPNLRDEHGDSPLHIAVTLNREPGVAQTLLGGGADAGIRNSNGKTPLHLAVEEERLDLIPLLLAYGADMFAADNSGVTPVDRAIQKGAASQRFGGGDSPDAGSVLEALITPETVRQSDSAGNTVLHTAVRHKVHPNLVAFILEQRALINARTREGDTPLHIAVRLNQRENGEILISRGADIFAVNSAGESPLYLALASSGGVRQWLFNHRTAGARDGLGNSILHYAAQWKMDSYIPFIIQKGVAADAVNATGETPLFMAVKHDGESTVRTLLKASANLHARDSLGNSVLHAAVRWNAQNSALALIESGIDLNTHSLNGNTPLHDAVRLGTADIEGILLSRGADLEARNGEGNTPFMEAVIAGFSGSVDRLAARGADPRTRNARGDTPLHIAVAMERSDLVRVLLGMGVSIHARNTQNRSPFQTALGVSARMVSVLLTKDRVNGNDDQGNSALHIAIQEKASPGILKVILDQGARPGAVDSGGRTPLRLAADMGAWEHAKYLADSGSDPFSTANDSKTPAEIALAHSPEGVYALFSGSAINARDSSGNTILHYAARRGSTETISLLLELGANKNLRNIAAESPADIARRWNRPANLALLN